MSIEDVTIAYSVLRRDIGKSHITSIISINRANHSNVTPSIHLKHTAFISIVMRTDEELKCTSIVQRANSIILMVSDPTFIKLSLYSF